MLDYLRSLTKSDEEKRREALSAFLDDGLAPEQKRQVEKDLDQDESLRADLGQMRRLRQEMRQLPQRQVRRNFTLDPALYGRPRREPLVQAYPVLRTATALAAFFFMIALAANLILNGSAGMISSAEPVAMTMESSEEVIVEAAAEEAAAAPAAPAAKESDLLAEADQEQIVAEVVTVDSEAEMPADEPESAQGLLPLQAEADAALPQDRAPSPDEPQTESAAAENELAVMPTMTAEGPAGPEMAVEQQELPMAAATEPVLSSPRSADGDLGEIGASPVSREMPTAGNDSVLLANSLSLIALLFGIVFAILIVLTLLARRRL